MDFDPQTQNVTFLMADGKTDIVIPITDIDHVNFETASICISYGSQIGASLIMLLTVLVMTPLVKLRRPSSILHVLGLTLSTIRTTLLSVYFVTPFNEFYNFWSADASRVPLQSYQITMTTTVISLLLAITLEIALMNQAWSMVSLWPPVAKYSLCIMSVGITLLTIGWKFAATVVQGKAIMSVSTPQDYFWIYHWSVITNVISVCWFCALFNTKLVIHLVSNRGILPSYQALTPMEVLVMANGLLMIIPVIFSALEWGHFTNFESASLILTSVAIILPMGSLAAQRMTQSSNMGFCSASSTNRGGQLPSIGTWPNWPGSSPPFKPGSFSSSSRTATVPQVSVMSRCEAGRVSRERVVPTDGELNHLGGGRVRVDHDLEQHVDRA